MTEREALKMALKALESDWNGVVNSPKGEAIIALRQIIAKKALAQPEQEPVAHVRVVDGMLGPVRRGKGMALLSDGDYSVYTSPPQRQPLTDDEVTKHFQENVDTGSLLSFADGVRFAEAAHRIAGDK